MDVGYKVRVFDDDEDKDLTVVNTLETLADPRLLAIAGIWSSLRGSYVVDSIGRAQIPFISEMSVDQLFAQHPNVYTLARSVRGEVSVFLAYAKQNAIKRLAYAGMAQDNFAEAYLGHLIDANEGPGIVSSFWETEETTVADYDRAIDSLLAMRAGLIVLALGSKSGARFHARMKERRISLPVFISYGSIAKVLKDDGGASEYGGVMYELSTGGVPNLNNERIERLARELGIRIGDNSNANATYSARDLGYGARYADVVQLIVDAAAGKLQRRASAREHGGQPDDGIAAISPRVVVAIAGNLGRPLLLERPGRDG